MSFIAVEAVISNVDPAVKLIPLIPAVNDPASQLTVPPASAESGTLVPIGLSSDQFDKFVMVPSRIGSVNVTITLFCVAVEKETSGADASAAPVVNENL